MNYNQSNSNNNKYSTWNSKNTKNTKMVGYSNVLHQSPLTKFYPYSNNQNHQNESENEFFIIENNNYSKPDNRYNTTFSSTSETVKHTRALQNSFNQTQKSVNIFSQLSNFHNSNSGQVANSLEQLKLNSNKRLLDDGNEDIIVKFSKQSDFVRNITIQRQKNFSINKSAFNDANNLQANRENSTDHQHQNIKAKIPDNQKLRIITGNVESTIKTIKSFPNINAFFEVFAQVINKRSGKYHSEQILLLRNAVGPVLQGFYYEIDFKLINFNMGSHVRCVGRFTGHQRFHILKITPCSNNPSEIISRMQTMCNLMLIKDRDKDRL